MYILIILILSIVVLLLSISIFVIGKRATYLSRKDKDFISFVIDMYIDYGDEIGVSSVEEHETIVNELKRIKNNKISDK